VTVLNADFSEALDHLKGGESVQREGWNGKGMWLRIQQPGELDKMTVPFIYMYTTDGEFVPWLASQTDLLSEDWVLM
jgi:hypothetical protein